MRIAIKPWCVCLLCLSTVLSAPLLAVSGSEADPSAGVGGFLTTARRTSVPSIPASEVSASGGGSNVENPPELASLHLTVVSEQAAKEMFSEIANDKEIPFDYPEGCDAKAHKAVVMLEQKGIIAGKAFVEGNIYYRSYRSEQDGVFWSRDFNLKPFWQFHVAPVILVGTPKDARPFIIDPFLAKEPVPYEAWIALVKKDRRTTISRAYFTNRFVYEPFQGNIDLDRYDPASIADMDKKLKDLLHAQEFYRNAPSLW